MVKKKKVLLVIPNVGCNWGEWPVPPIGIPYVSAYMKKQGISVHCLNLPICDEPMKTLEQTIRQEQIDIVATGDLVVNYLAVKEIVDCAKMVSPYIITIIGGGVGYTFTRGGNAVDPKRRLRCDWRRRDN